ncbi:hypothetical protein AGMMS50249_2410 [candidate division SR1 bacterium]|nr:hypothetical protein AGMMS50249_2410 [candidate division SR1 bacterium]
MSNFYSGFYGDDGLRVAPLKKGKKADIKLQSDSAKPAFKVENEGGGWDFFYGLENFIQLKNERGKPIYVFDNHNHALRFWWNFLNNGQGQASRKGLIHIDQHTDRRENQNIFDKKWMNRDGNNYEREVFDFVQRKTEVGNFITPALDSVLVSDYHEIRSEYQFNHFDINLLDGKPYILDIDLDFRAEEMGISFKKTVEKLKSLIEKAEIITIATSPYFLDQKVAIELLIEAL